MCWKIIVPRAIQVISTNWKKVAIKVTYIETYYYFCTMRKLRLFDGYFEQFMKMLSPTEQKKLNYILDLLKWNERVSSKFVKHLLDGLFEIRMEYNGNIFRVFFIFDEGNIIVLFNGFQKKSQKTPISEITKALKIKEDYYASKQQWTNRLRCCTWYKIR